MEPRVVRVVDANDVASEIKVLGQPELSAEQEACTGDLKQAALKCSMRVSTS